MYSFSNNPRAACVCGPVPRRKITYVLRTPTIMPNKITQRSLKAQAQQDYANRICTSLPSSLRIA
jgi:hypothetical protein